MNKKLIFFTVFPAAADQNLRDWSGKKPRQYQASRDTTISADTFRSKSDTSQVKEVAVPPGFLQRRESRRENSKFTRNRTTLPPTANPSHRRDKLLSSHSFLVSSRSYNINKNK